MVWITLEIWRDETGDSVFFQHSTLSGFYSSVEMYRTVEQGRGSRCTAKVWNGKYHPCARMLPEGSALTGETARLVEARARQILLDYGMLQIEWRTTL